MKRLVVGNWKMNFSTKESLAYVEKLAKNITKPTSDIVICPNLVSLQAVSSYIEKKSINFSVGAQNVSQYEKGAYTGETSANMIKGLADYCIVGHSERRQMYFEDNPSVALKAAACIRNKIKPILCVGENLRERNEGLARRKVLDQIQVGLSDITPQEATRVVIAYEPVWAIGSGENASPHDAESMLISIYTYLVNRYGEDTAKKFKLLYGGSVNSDNANSYLSLNKCDGLLVGGASLNFASFGKICQL